MASLHQIVADQISPGNRIISSFGASEGQAAADLLPWHTGKNITAVILICDLKVLTIGKYQFPAHLKFHMENRDRQPFAVGNGFNLGRIFSFCDTVIRKMQVYGQLPRPELVPEHSLKQDQQENQNQDDEQLHRRFPQSSVGSGTVVRSRSMISLPEVFSPKVLAVVRR